VLADRVPRGATTDSSLVASPVPTQGGGPMNDLRARALLGLGVTLALVTGLLLYTTLNASAEQRDLRMGQDLVVARVAIAANAPIAQDALERRSYPVELVPTGAVTDPGVLVGQRLSVAVPAGAAILRSFIAGPAGASSGAVVASPGQLVVSFPTNDPLTAAGLVQVGDRVDVLATVTASEGRITQKTIQDLEVLAVTGRDQSRALVFSVDDQTALVLKYLRDSGAAIDIALRARTDTTTVRTQAVDLVYVTQTFGIKR